MQKNSVEAVLIKKVDLSLVDNCLEDSDGAMAGDSLCDKL
jgi:hypothetical protein